MISVFRKTGDGESVVCRLSDRNAKLTQECMGKDEVSVQVTVDEVLPIREMDYIRVDGAVYTLNRMTDYDEVSDVEFRYNLIFEGVIYNLMDKMYVDVERNSDRFSLTGTLQEFTDLLVVNINSVDAGWSRGDVPETERKNLTFESVSCREVLNRLASEFGVEYYLKGRKVCFTDRFENRTSLVFERGKGKGLYKLTCRNADTGNTVTRVRVYGSTENLPVGYRNGQADRLQLPMMGGKPTYYLEDYSEFSKVVERTVHFDDVKPTFKGEVKTVSDEYNRRIICPAIDFDLKEVAVGDNARVNFLTGDLAGVAFRFEWDKTKKELNLIRQEDQMELPDADGKRPLIPNANKKAVAGDEFNFTGINLPQAYVDRAEQVLLAKGREWLSFYKQLRVNFSLDVDYRFLRDSGYTLHVGDVVTVKVPKLGMEKMLRVLSVDKDLNSGKLSCNVSNYLTESWEKKIEGQIQATQSSVDRVNLNASYLVEATKEWVAQRFARLAGGNRFVGKQEVDGDVELAADRRLSIGDAVMRVAKGLFRTVLSVAGKNGEDVEIEAAGMKAKQVTAEEVSTPDFVSGFLGSGARLKDSHLELDELTVRKRMNVYELMIEKVKSVGGNLIVSVGSAKIEAVADAGGSFRCTYQHNEAGTVYPFVVDDQVLCQTFGGKNARRYWRRVVAVGDGYFDLSKTDCEAGSAMPEAGDEVVQLGNRTDRSRQSAILLCAVGADAPYTDHYDGIDGFSLAGKLVSREGKLTGIVDEAFGQLSGAGLYAKNAYLRGNLALSTGQKVEERISELGQEQILQKETLTELKADQDGFSVRVSSVEEKATAAEEAVNGLQIGGVNLLNGCMTGLGWTYSTHKDSTFSMTTSARTEVCYIYSPLIMIGGNREIVLSFEAKCDDNVNDCDFYILPNSYNQYGFVWSSYDKSKDWKYFEFKFKTPGMWGQGDDIVPVKFRVDHNGSTDGQNATIWIRNVQIEYGNKATSWKLPVADQQAMIDSVKTGTRNYISKKYLLDWNRTDEDIAVWGKDGEGFYLSIDHKKLHDCVALADGFEGSVDVFGGKIAYKPNTQYVFCVDWKLTAAQSHVGIDFLIWYSDGSYSEVYLERDCLRRKRTNVITDQGKSVVKISAAYGTEGARSLIYDIGLVEGNRAPVNIPVAEEDLKGASHVNLADGTKSVLLPDAGGNWNYMILHVPMLKPNTVYNISFRQAEVLSGNPAGFSFVLYNKSITKVRGSVMIPAGEKSGVLITTNDFSAEDGYLLIYGGVVGATKGVSVKYSEVMLVEGFLAPDSWSQSVGDVGREINDVSDALKDLDSTITTTFKDGVIQAAEAKAIEQNINSLQAEMKDIDAQYADLYGNAYVSEEAKQGLVGAKLGYNAAHAALLNAIRAAIADGVTNEAEKADVDVKFTAYGTALAVYKKQAGALQKVIQDELNSRASRDASNKALGRSWASGKMLYMDPTFKVGNNGVYPYNHGETSTVSVTRVDKLADSPVIDSDYNLEIKNTGVAYPGLGGFYFATVTRANAVLITRFIAKIPTGYSIHFATNLTGEGAESFWSTSNAGTGNWEEYIYVVKCGSEGLFSSTMFFYLTGVVGTPDNPVVWYLAYASVFDVTSGVNTAILAKEAAEAATVKLSEWASDSKISPAEKTGLKQQLADICAEYADLEAKAQRYDLKRESAWTAYQGAYNLAVAALNKYTAVSPECISIDSDYADIEAYYTKRQAFIHVVSNYSLENGLIRMIDATSLDPDKYYPVTFYLYGGVRSKLNIKSNLSQSGVPYWATHSGGFACKVSWSVNGCGWGTITTDRYIDNYAFSWTDTSPIGSIGQMSNSSHEYIYVRGGGKYYVQATNVMDISLRTEEFSLLGETIRILDGIVPPTPNLDVVRTELDAKITAAEGKINLIASKKEFDQLGGNNTMMSLLTVAYDGIKLLAKNGDIGTGIVIDPKRIEITGETVFRNSSGDQIRFFGSGNDVFNINNGVFRVDKNGKATMTNCEITGGKFMDFNLIPGMMQTATSTKGQITISSAEASAPYILLTKVVSGQSASGTIYMGGIPAVSDKIILEVDDADILHRRGTFKGDAITCNSLSVSGAVYFTSLSKITNTNGWDRVLVNLTTKQIAYG